MELQESVIYFFVGIKTFEISACQYLKPHFYENCKQLRNPTTDFSLTSARNLSALQFYICKFEGNRDRKTRCTKCWSNLTLKCYADTFVKVDAQIEEDCRQTISYLKGYSYLKLYCKKQGNQKLTGEYSQHLKKNNFKLSAGDIKELLFIKLTLYLSLSFGNKS